MIKHKTEIDRDEIREKLLHEKLEQLVLMLEDKNNHYANFNNTYSELAPIARRMASELFDHEIINDYQFQDYCNRIHNAKTEMVTNIMIWTINQIKKSEHNLSREQIVTSVFSTLFPESTDYIEKLKKEKPENGAIIENPVNLKFNQRQEIKEDQTWSDLSKALRERATKAGVDLSSLGYLDQDIIVLCDLMPEHKEAPKVLHRILSTAFSQMNNELEKLPERAGVIKFNQYKRFEIRRNNAWADELTCGSSVSVFINGDWIDTSIEYVDSKGYCFTNPKIKIKEGLIAVLSQYK